MIHCQARCSIQYRRDSPPRLAAERSRDPFVHLPLLEFNLLGGYDFSDEKLWDSIGIRPHRAPKIDPLNGSRIWGLPNRLVSFSHRDL